MLGFDDNKIIFQSQNEWVKENTEPAQSVRATYLPDIENSVSNLYIYCHELESSIVGTSYPGPANAKALVKAGHVTRKSSQILGVFLNLIKIYPDSQGGVERRELNMEARKQKVPDSRRQNLI